jgi:hypothetical protein
MENQEDSFPLKLYHYISKFPEVQLKNEAEISEINRKVTVHASTEFYPLHRGTDYRIVLGYGQDGLLLLS